MIASRNYKWFDPVVLGAAGRLKVSARRPLGGQFHSYRKARRTGASMEFAENRIYSPGDDPRSLDWNAYARHEKFYTRLFHDEEDMHVTILVDASSSMRTILPGRSDGFACARASAGLIAHVALAGQLQVSLGFFSSTLDSFSEPLRGRSRFHRALEFLDSPPAKPGPTAFTTAINAMIAASPRRTLVVVISDFLDRAGIDAPLQKLLHRRCDLALIEIFDSIAIESIPNGPMNLVDAETGEEVMIDNPIEALRSVQHRSQARSESLRHLSRKWGIPLARLAAGSSPESQLRTLMECGILIR